MILVTVKFNVTCWKESARQSARLPLTSNLSVIPTGRPKAFPVTLKSAVQ